MRALSQLSVCSHLSTVYPTTISRFRYKFFPERPSIFFVSTIHQVIWPSPGVPSTLYGGKVAGLIWIRFAAEALRFSFAKSSRPPLKM